MKIIRGKRIEISNEKYYNYPFCVICILFFVEPLYFAQGPLTQVHSFYHVIQVSLSLVITGLYFLKMFNKDIQPITILIFAYEIHYMLVTIFKGGDIRQSVINAFFILALSLLLEMELTTNPMNIIKAVEVVFCIYISINFVTVLLFPGGMYRNQIGYYLCWFLGFKNVSVPILLVGMTISLYRCRLLGKRISLTSFFIVTFSILYVYIVRSATGIISITIMAVYIAIKFFSDRRIIIFNYFVLTIINIFGFILLVFFRVQNNFSIFSDLAEVLGKNITFTGRTILWDKLILIWLSSPIFGIGLQDNSFYVAASHYWGNVHAHSEYFQVLIESGIIGFALFCAILFVAGKNISKQNKSNESDTEILIFGTFVYMIAMQMEHYSQVLTLFILLECLYYCNYSNSSKTDMQFKRRLRVRL